MAAWASGSEITLSVTGTMDSVMAGSFPGRLHSSYMSRCCFVPAFVRA